MDPLRGLPLLEDLPDVDGKRVLVRVDFNVPLHIGVRGRATVADDFRIRPPCRPSSACSTRAPRSWRPRTSGGRRARPDPRWEMDPVRERLARPVPRRRADREPALRPGREGQRPGLRGPAGRRLRRLRQRGLRGGPPRARLDRRAAPVPAQRGRTALRPGGRGARRPAGRPGPPLRGRRGRGQGGRQARGAQGPGHQGGHPGRRRRHGLHLPGRPRPARRRARCSTRRTSRTAGRCSTRASRSCCRPTPGPSSPAAPSVLRRRRTGRGGASRSSRATCPTAGPASTSGRTRPPPSPTAVERAGTVLWNGPMGVFEDSRFAGGPRWWPRRWPSHPGFTVVGGGDSASALEELGLADRIDFLSTGGGASLSFIESEGHLPGSTPCASAPNAPRAGERPPPAGQRELEDAPRPHRGAAHRARPRAAAQAGGRGQVDVSVHPPFTDLRTVQTLVEKEHIPVALGAQHCSDEDAGARTGEVSPRMLARLGTSLRDRRPLRAPHASSAWTTPRWPPPCGPCCATR